MDRSDRRVVVTGLGMVTPVGLDVESTWESLREGRGGVGPISLFDAGTFPTRIAAELKGFRLARDLGDDAARWSPTAGTPRSRWRRRARRSHMRGSWTTRDPTRRGSGSTSGRGKASRISPGSSTSCSGADPTTGSTRAGSPSWASGCCDPLQEAEQEPGTPSGHLASRVRRAGPTSPA